MRTVPTLKGANERGEGVYVRLDAGRAAVLAEHCASLGIGAPELIRRLIDGLRAATGDGPVIRVPPMPKPLGNDVIGWRAQDLIDWLSAVSTPPEPVKPAEVA